MSASRLIELDLPAVPESALTARRAILEALTDVAVDRDAVAGVVAEAVANSVVHGYATRPGRVRITAELGEQTLEVEIADDGVGISESTQSAGLGLGLPLIDDLADEVEVQGGRGTKVRAQFELFGAAGPHGRTVPRHGGIGRSRERVNQLEPPSG